MSADRVNLLFGLTLHCREPVHPTHLEAFTGSYGIKGKWTDCLVLHPIRGWAGISYRDKWFFGFMSFKERRPTRRARP